MKLLITGGTVFVSRFAARYFADRGHEVTVLNRGSRPQERGVRLIQADRHQLGDALKGETFDAVLDICAYTAQDVTDLLEALPPVKDYILISSSAVYPETLPQPFSEDQPVGPNRIWGAYGANKIEAEKALLAARPDAYILRPPYLYGPMQNLYREPFGFDCARLGRPFYLPEDGMMKLQFFHVEDLCRMMENLLTIRPDRRIWNVGNPECITVKEFATLCYEAVGTPFRWVQVWDHPSQRDYFSFYPYEYALDVTCQQAFLGTVKPLDEGFRESWAWYREHMEEVRKRDFIGFIDAHLK